MSKFARMKGCFPEGEYTSYLCSRWKKQSVEIPPRFHQELLDYVRSSLKDCAGGLPNTTAPRLSFRKIYPRETNTRSSGFLEVGAVWLSGLDRCHRLRNLGVFWIFFLWNRGKSREAWKQKCEWLIADFIFFCFVPSHTIMPLCTFCHDIMANSIIFVGTNSDHDLNLPE